MAIIDLAQDLTTFEYPSAVRYSEVGHRGLMTLPAVINAFQDCSTFQSEALGVGMAWLKHVQRAWVLTHWHIIIDRYPSLCEEISVGTFATRFRGFSAHRNFYLKDGSGSLIARASYTWAFIDRTTAVHRVLERSVSHDPDYRRRIAFCDSTDDIALWFDARYGGGRARGWLRRRRMRTALWVLSYHGPVCDYVARWWRDVRRTPWLLFDPAGYVLLFKKFLPRRRGSTQTPNA